jgi:hypothetical protein
MVANTSDTDLIDESQIALIELPVFNSRIPSDLLEQVSKRDRHVLDTLSVLAQQMDFNTSILLQQNKQIRALDARIRRIDKWRTVLLNKWSPWIALFVMALPFIISRLIDSWWPHKP